MDFTADEGHDEIRQAVRELCAGFPAAYWRGLEPSTYPEEFVETLTEQGWLAVLIPEEFGGAGLGLTAASIVLEEINASGGNAAACHAQMYTMGTILRHGSIEQKSRFLPKIASGDLRLQAFGVTEPTVGSDTTNIKTIATRVDGGYVVRGQKIWTSRAEHSDLMLLLARTTPADEVEKKTEGLSVFVVDMKAAGDAISIRPIKTIMNHATTEVFIDDLQLPQEALVGEEGKGFRYILDGMNSERILIAAECIGDGRWFVQRGIEVRIGADRFWSAHRVQSRRSVSHCARPCGSRGSRPRPLQSRLAVRERATLWSGGEHGKTAGLRGIVDGSERMPRHVRRIRIRRGI